MFISLVVAAAENDVIGKDNQLLWHLPNDMKFFKNVTWGMPVIMGRKTYESMNGSLKGRTNIVITRDENFEMKHPQAERAADTDEALARAAETDAKECFVIGGGEIFNMFMAKANRIYLTRVHAAPQGDVNFPKIDPSAWQLAEETHFAADNRHAYSYTFQTWLRKSDRN